MNATAPVHARAFISADASGGNAAWVMPVGRESTALAAGMDGARALARATGVEVTLEAAGRDFRFFAPAGELSLCLHGLLAGLALARSEGRIAEDDPRGSITTPSGALTAQVRSVDAVTFEVSVGLGPQLLAPVEAGPDVRRELAAALGLSPAELPERLWNAGGARLKTLVPLTRRDRLAALTPRSSLIDRLAPLLGSTGLYAFVVERSDTDSAHIAARHFPAGIGIVEDPATGGSAVAPALWLRRVVSHRGLSRLMIAQGDDMGRPCLLRVTGPGGEDDGTGWRVGGRVVLEPAIAPPSWRA